MFYRLDGLIDAVADHGVLPHLLAIAAVQRDHSYVWLRPGTTLRLENHPNPHEVDLLGLVDGKLAYGEVKSEGFRLTPEEIKNDIDICAKIGVDSYILAALDDIPGDVAKHARDLCERQGIVLSLLPYIEPSSESSNAGTVVGSVVDATSSTGLAGSA